MRMVLLLAIFTLAMSEAPAAETPRGIARFATFNASLNRDAAGKLVHDLATPDDPQARNVAEIIQRAAPDVLLINEFDYDPRGEATESFQEKYLAVGQNGATPIRFPYRFSAEVNTGQPSGFDLDNDGKVVKEPGARGYGNDAIGFGLFPGQYGMVLYSKHPIDREGVRQLGRILWKDMPGALLPAKADGTPWYSAEELGVLRLSSKSHWDVPVRVDGRVIHVLVSHPTPPAFDGPEDRNGRRNHDEIRMWADYLTGGAKAAYLFPTLSPDRLPPPPATFVILGDLNADPNDGGSVAGAVAQLLGHPRVNARFVPRSVGAAEAARVQGGANDRQRGLPENDTADFADNSVGNLRADYVLPSKDLKVIDGGVFWPAAADPLSRLVRMSPVASSDHRLVFLDLDLGGAE